jgi:hypothetical protein
MPFTVCRLPFAVGVRDRNSVRTALAADGAAAHGSARAYVECLDQPRQHLFDVRSGLFVEVRLGGCEKPEISRQQDKVNELVGGTGRNVKKLAEFRVRRSSTPLGDVGRDGRRCSSHLACQAVSLRKRIGGRSAIDTQSEAVALPPNLQVPEVLHLVPPSASDLETLSRLCTRWQVPAYEYERRDEGSNGHYASGSRILTADGERQTANGVCDVH